MSKGTIRPYPAPNGRGHARTPEPEWELTITGDLTDKQGDLIEKLAGVPRRSRGTIYFNSCGGSVFTGLALAATIRLRGLDPLGVVAGECSSAAILPFAACRRRVVFAYSTLLFHPVRWQSDENVRLEEANEWARYFTHLEPALDELLSKMLGCPLETLNKWTRPGRFVTGQEIADAGLATMVDLLGGDLWGQLGEKPGSVALDASGKRDADIRR